MSGRARGIVFALVACGFLCGAAYHAVGLFGDPARVEPSPPWRHAVFIAVNLGCALGVAFRPRWFVAAFALLVAQQVASHGMYAWRVLRAEGRIDGASVIVLVTMPAVLFLLARDARRRGSADPAQDA